jgi:hypothetical protein
MALSRHGILPDVRFAPIVLKNSTVEAEGDHCFILSVWTGDLNR